MSSAPAAQVVLPLGRGGARVQTSIGPVQFGAPPETIKDALQAGLAVPSIFVLPPPSAWFSRRRGLTIAELEFPVYYNYFMLSRRVTAVTDAEGAARLGAVLRESLFGPQAIDPAQDYDPSVPADARADLIREADWFRRKPGTAERIELDDVLAVLRYDGDGRVRLGGEVEIQRQVHDDGWTWTLRDGGRVLAEISSDDLGDDLGAHPHPRGPEPPAALHPFAPPELGLTVLGSSHGFDPAGKTTGFVLWINRRGILVDPPTESTVTLRQAGVAPDVVDSVILTHCHADHDAGVFQKVLEAQRVALYTTPTILGSFLRKYVALTGEPEERLRQLFELRPVTIGAPLHIHGGAFRFFYTLHSIPTIGFECRFGGKSFIYSADTLWDPPQIAALADAGVIRGQRRDALVDFPWDRSLVLHEAGVPPIHTPPARLAELPAEVKQRLRLIHIAEADLPAGCGLRLARTGFEHTIVLPVPRHPHADAIEALDALAAMDLFHDFNVARCRDFLAIAARETLPAGALVIGQGEPGERVYIIVSGQAVVVRDGAVLKTYHAGDFFGETALVTGAPRSADVRAKTDLVALAIEKTDFLAFLRGTDLMQGFLRLARNRDLPSWDLMSDNRVLSGLRPRQRTRLQARLEHCRLETDHILWDVGQVAAAAWILDDAEVEVHEGRRVATVGRAAWLGDIDAVTRGRRQRTRAVVVRGGGAFRIGGSHLAEVLEATPALTLSLAGALFVR
jgi:CRP-like cAMP-binding protein/glyoxylase-like metal-dependent hydrolase (beta-lactamase superfamily II)